MNIQEGLMNLWNSTNLAHAWTMDDDFNLLVPPVAGYQETI